MFAKATLAVALFGAASAIPAYGGHYAAPVAYGHGYAHAAPLAYAAAAPVAKFAAPVVAKVAEPIYAPQPYSFGYDTVDEYGTKQSRHEKSDGHNNKVGSYGFTDARGIFRKVDYVADKAGFRATINTNEPGTAPSAPAAALYNAPVAKVAVAAPVVAKVGIAGPVVAKATYAAPAYAAAPLAYAGGYKHY